MNEQHQSFGDDTIPDLLAPPKVIREFVPRPWHRPRKQFIRMFQWNHYIREKILSQRRNTGLDRTLRILGLPSHDFLDLLSMQELCESEDFDVAYLGYNSQLESGEVQSAVDLYSQLQDERMIETSSFINPSSRLVKDRFENIVHDDHLASITLKQFPHFDVVNLDLCGCIVDPNEHRAGAVLDAITELVNRQATGRLSPWLLFVTTFADRESVNRTALQQLLLAINQNVAAVESFRNHFKSSFDVIVENLCTGPPDAVELPASVEFRRLFCLAFAKWLSLKLKQTTPNSLISMLPSYEFRHENMDTPMLISLAYLVKPVPKGGVGGWLNFAIDKLEEESTKRYEHSVVQLISKCRDLRDLDEITDEPTLKRQLSEQTRDMLVGCGYRREDVEAFLFGERGINNPITAEA